MNILPDFVKEQFDMLCIKYRKALLAVDASEIDTLLGVVYDSHLNKKLVSHYSLGATTLSEEVFSSSIDDEINTLLEELRHIYELLEEKGMSPDDVREALWPITPISRLQVEENLCIRFPDYDDKQIRFSRMQYALYRLFLNHPEGIFLKLLPDYIDELRTIYIQSYHFTGGNLNLTNMEEKLRNITDPTKHTIIEYLSHIRNTIVTSLGSDSIARNYYIRGSRNHSYKITLSRKFVDYTPQY